MHPERQFATSSVALVLGKIRNTSTRLSVRDQLNDLITTHQFLKGAPFLWVGLVFLYGIKNDLNVRYERINKKYGDLPITLELDMKILQWADQNNLTLLHDIFMIAALEALIQVGQKYKLPLEPLVGERAKYGSIPNTIEECVKYKSSSQVIP